MEKQVAGMMVLSCFVDILLLTGAGKLTGYGICRSGMFAAALLGAGYKAACMIPCLSALNHMLVRLLAMILMGMLTFGWSKRALRPAAAFAVLQMALNGLVSGTEAGNIWPVLLSGMSLWLLCVFGYRLKGGSIIPAELSYEGNTVKIRALVDTGNLLKDPLTGEAVLVVCNQLGAMLAGLTEKQIEDPIQTMMEMPHHKLRLLPYHTVGQKSGMMLAMKIDQVKLQGKQAGNLIAFAPCGLGMQQDYQALVGGI